MIGWLVSVAIAPFSPLLGAIGVLYLSLRCWQARDRRLAQEPGTRWINTGLLIWVGALLISTSQALYPREALLGLFNFVPFVGVFWAARCQFDHLDRWRSLAWAMVLPSLGVSGIGFGQLFLGWHGPIALGVIDWALTAGGDPPGRMSSVFFHANTLANYAAIVLMLTIGLWFDLEQRPHQAQPERQQASQKRLQKIFLGFPKHLPQYLGKYLPRHLLKRLLKRSIRFLSRPLFQLLFQLLPRHSPHPGQHSSSSPINWQLINWQLIGRVVLIAIGLCNFTVILLTSSRNGWGVTFLGCLLFALYRHWWQLVIAVQGLLLSCAAAAFAPEPIARPLRTIIPRYIWARLNDQMYPDRPFGSLRSTQWHFALQLMGDRPLTGWGLRSFSELYTPQYQFWIGHPHNLYLMLGAETGLIATGLLLAIVGGTFYKALSCLRFSPQPEQPLRVAYAIALSVTALYHCLDITLFQVPINLYGWLLFAVLANQTHPQSSARLVTNIHTNPVRN